MQTCLHIGHLVSLERSNFAMFLESSGVVNWVANPLKMFVKMLTHLHLVVYTWWCWHIYKGEEVGVVVDQLREEKRVFRCTSNYRMVLGLEYYFDPMWFGLSMHVGCVGLWVSFPKCPRSSKSEFGAKSYSRFSAKRFVTGLCDLRVWSAPARPITESGQCF